ncbi:MAG: hypothetical protein LBJ13_03840 [Puniceicoccales bacterium]|jgi:beta-glucosidase-like glycosyl hydrolase|nr:hypothetical protein [Puniceicoccales bacterium]
MHIRSILLPIIFYLAAILRTSIVPEPEHLPVIFAVSGKELTANEVAFMEKYRPIGIILSEWNFECDEQGNVNGEKLIRLCDEIRRYSPYILIDQEGGRVQHLQGANCYRAPAAGTFTAGKESIGKKCEALRQSVRSIDGDLLKFGINVNCAPVCDLLFDGIPSFIGDRSFGTDPNMVYCLAVSWVKQAAAEGIVSVLKHCPGHGSVVGDSHKGLPVVEKSLSDLRGSDFKIFEDVINGLYGNGISKDLFWVMIAHVMYREIDAEHCATQSPKIISMIREEFNFQGKIVSDCIVMKALEGELWERAVSALEAGCDYVICVDHNLERKAVIAEKVTGYLVAKRVKNLILRKK